MQQATPRTQRNKRLHVVYFVDAARTKSFSVSLRALAVGTCASAAVLVGAGASLFASARLAVQVEASQDHVRELKRGILAQSVAFEHALSGAGRDEEKAVLSRSTHDLEREIAANADAPARVEGRGKRPLDLAKVTNGLTNLDAATLNLVAARAADGTGVPGGATGPSPLLSNTSSRETGITTTPGAPPRVVASADVHPARAGGPGAPDSGGKSLRAAPLVPPGSLPGSGSRATTAASATAASASGAGTTTSIAARSVRETTVKVTFDHVVLLPIGGANVTTPSKAYPAATSSSHEGNRGDGNAEGGFAAESATNPPPSAKGSSTPAATPTSTRVRFTLTNHDPGRALVGRVCLVALLGDAPAEGAGTGGVITVPSGLPLPAGPRSNPTGCPGGQLVRFSRLRPTEMLLSAPPSRLRGLVLHFSEGPGKSHHSLAWTAPDLAPPPR